MSEDVQSIFPSEYSDLMPLQRMRKGKTRTRVKNRSAIPLSGTTVQNLYLDVVESCPLSSNEHITTEKKRLQHRKQKSRLVDLKLNVNTVMKAVEQNDVKTILNFLQIRKDFVLTCTDQYGWTALMCACCAGAKDVVKLLLRFEPNLNVRDKKGKTCLTLAKEKGHTSVLELLKSYKKGSIKPKASVQAIDDFSEYYCELCRGNFKQTKESHITSVVHLFNDSKRSSVPTAYGIPESNVGFQMLLKTGWNREKGLGPEGTGQKFPPKTMLKQDRTGLGAKKYTARITHKHEEVVKNSLRSETQRTVNKKERQRAEWKNKRREIELRRELD